MLLNMWRYLLLLTVASTVNSCAVREEKYGKICVCNETYCDNAPKVSKLAAGQVQIVFTSNENPGFNVKDGKFTESTTAAASVIVDVNSTKTFQKIIGFGGAFTDATGINMRTLPEALQKKLIEAYFGEDGLEYTLCRVPMGGTDFSTRTYTLDDHHGDNSLKQFALQKEDLLYKV